MSKDIKERIIKDTAKYNLVQYFSQFLGFFSAMAIRRFLGPYYMGIWSLFRVVIDYSSCTSLGVESAATYKIPFLKGKGDKKSEKEDLSSSIFVRNISFEIEENEFREFFSKFGKIRFAKV